MARQLYYDIADPARLVELVHWNPNNVHVYEVDTGRTEDWTPDEFVTLFEPCDMDVVTAIMFPND